MMIVSPLISVIIPARMQDCSLILGILGCLERQTMQDFEVIVVCDRTFPEVEWDFLQYFIEQKSKIASKVRFFSHLNSDFVPKSPGGASYVRNFGIEQSRGAFIQLFDDDNRFEPHYLAQVLGQYKKRKEQLGTEVVITPTLLLRDSGNIQNQGFSGYNYRLARPKVHFHQGNVEFEEIEMFSGNGVFASATLIKTTKYDEEIAWIAEDLDFVYCMHKKGAKILNFSEIFVYHREREKTILEQAWIGNSVSAQQKIKNIFVWHKKHATWSQLLLFVLWSSWGIVVWLSIKAVRYGQGQKWDIIKGLRTGYMQGWTQFIR